MRVHTRKTEKSHALNSRMRRTQTHCQQVRGEQIYSLLLLQRRASSQQALVAEADC